MVFVESPANVPVLIVDDLYSVEELNLILKELAFLTSPNRLQAANITGTASTESGELKKTASGIFLDSFYANREYSDILRINRKLFDPVIQQRAIEKNIFYQMLYNVNLYYTLINYYDNLQRYKPHHDVTVFTAITFFFQEPKKFSGGDLIFTDFDFTVPIKNNRLVLFPGAFIHEVAPVIMNENLPPYSGYGRYSMAQFLHIQPPGE
jgi:Rps23 Pro-64 3,4-dihydroxylase Tpa1-like proline 4-hydroxylase